MSDCMGGLPVSTKTDREMRDYLSAESERLGVTRAEFIRRVLSLYRQSRRERVSCPHCRSTVKMDVRE
jgi:hypothetical protein